MTLRALHQRLDRLADLRTLSSAPPTVAEAHAAVLSGRATESDFRVCCEDLGEEILERAVTCAIRVYEERPQGRLMDVYLPELLAAAIISYPLSEEPPKELWEDLVAMTSARPTNPWETARWYHANVLVLALGGPEAVALRQRFEVRMRDHVEKPRPVLEGALKLRIQWAEKGGHPGKEWWLREAEGYRTRLATLDAKSAQWTAKIGQHRPTAGCCTDTPAAHVSGR